MALTVIHDNHGLPHTDFHELRNSLRVQGESLGEEHLPLIPYAQLSLCAMGTAGPDRMPLEVVHREKEGRRRRFLDIPQAEFQACQRYLRAEGMYDDLCLVRDSMRAIAWGDLHPTQKLWAILHCLHNHLDAPMARLDSALGLLSDTSIYEVYTEKFASDLRHQLVAVRSRVNRVNTRQLRNSVGNLAYEAQDALRGNHRTVTETLRIRDYQCTSDCFRVYVGGLLA